MIVRTGDLLLGHPSVAAGVVGLLLPLVPTTPVIILSRPSRNRVAVVDADRG